MVRNATMAPYNNCYSYFVVTYCITMKTVLSLFLSHISMLTCDINIAILSVRLSITFQYAMKMA